MYNPELLGVLQTLGLSALDRQGRLQAATHLIGGRWQFPADKNETFIPTIPILFVVLQSCTNVQYIDRHFQVAYVCKYAAGVQEHREATVSRPTDGGTVTVDVQNQKTIKKTGPAVASSLKPSASLAREVGQAEMTWYALGLLFNVTHTVYMHVSTLAPEYSSAVVRHRQSVAVVDGGGEDPIPVQRRRQLPAASNGMLLWTPTHPCTYALLTLQQRNVTSLYTLLSLPCSSLDSLSTSFSAKGISRRK